MLVDVAMVLAVLLVAVQLGCLAKTLADLRVEISSARWEWNKRLGAAQKGDDGLKPLDRLRADSLD